MSGDKLAKGRSGPLALGLQYASAMKSQLVVIETLALAGVTGGKFSTCELAVRTGIANANFFGPILAAGAFLVKKHPMGAAVTLAATAASTATNLPHKEGNYAVKKLCP